MPQPKQLKVELVNGGKSVEISAEVPIKGVAVYCESDEVVFEDNLVDVVPGETVTIGVKGAKGGETITSRYLGFNE